MVNCATLFDLEMHCIDQMTRLRLIDAVRERWDCLPLDLRVPVEEVTTEHLRLLLVAVRLIHALRQILQRKEP